MEGAPSSHRTTQSGQCGVKGGTRGHGGGGDVGRQSSEGERRREQGLLSRPWAETPPEGRQGGRHTPWDFWCAVEHESVESRNPPLHSRPVGFGRARAASRRARWCRTEKTEGCGVAFAHVVPCGISDRARLAVFEAAPQNNGRLRAKMTGPHSASPEKREGESLDTPAAHARQSLRLCPVSTHVTLPA